MNSGQVFIHFYSAYGINGHYVIVDIISIYIVVQILSSFELEVLKKVKFWENAH